MEDFKYLHGDSYEKIKELPDNSVDSIVTDPPYGLGNPPDVYEVMKDWVEKGYHDIKGKGFMGKEWDAFVPQPRLWKECLRVLKPGGHLLAFSGTRTQDWMGMSIRFAGFEIRDSIAWVYGSGFPKSHNIGKAVDKLQGNERELLGTQPAGTSPLKTGHAQVGGGGGFICDERSPELKITKGQSEFEGLGTALKPALEPIIVARKPISEKTIAENVLKWGTGGINIDESRNPLKGMPKISGGCKGTESPVNYNFGKPFKEDNSKGRYPSNICHDGSDEVLELFPNTKSGKMTESHTRHTDGSPNGIYGKFDANYKLSESYGDSGSAARFFYCAKASPFERNFGLEDEEEVTVGDGRKKEIDNPFQRGKTIRKNFHTTVKPVRLMIYLTRLVTPKGGTVLDPFAGSGTTGIGCKENGFKFIGIDNELDYIYLLKKRIQNWVVGILDMDKKEIKNAVDINKNTDNINKFF